MPEICPLCTHEDDVFLIEKLPDGGRRLGCRACDYEWSLSAPAATITKASGGSKPSQPAKSPTRYEQLKRVDGINSDGVEVSLLLQRRTSPGEEGPKTWFTTSWRTRLRPGGPNRRFYNVDGRPWLIDPAVALKLLTQLESAGGLDAVYAPPSASRQEVLLSDALDPTVRCRLLNEITGPGETWSDDCCFVITQDPEHSSGGGLWRRIMLVDPRGGKATFRSTTLHPTYMPRAELRPGLPWVLDNSMQDAYVGETQAFLQELQKRL